MDTPPQTPPRPALAYHHTPGTGPTIVFLPGYASDMSGTKAVALEAWARGAGRAFLRFDYGGCGLSEGAFDEQTLAGWRDDALALLEQRIEGPALLVGSSMGGWIGLLLSRDHPARVAGLVLIAPAPDFTDWGFTTDEKLAMLSEGRFERPSRYGDAPMVYTRGFWQSGEANRLMFGEIAVDCPVRILQGLSDVEVPWHRSVRLAEMLRSADVQAVMVKGGDHRMSRDGDIALLIETIEGLLPPP